MKPLWVTCSDYFPFFFSLVLYFMVYYSHCGRLILLAQFFFASFFKEPKVLSQERPLLN